MSGGGSTGRISSHADLMAHIDRLSQIGSAALGRVMLYNALQRREIALQEVIAGGSVATIKQFVRAVGDRPSVLLIGDDDGLDRGPAGFPGADKAIAWGRWFLVHAAGPEREHFAAAIAAAQFYGRVVVIECSSVNLPEWEALARRAPHYVGGLIVRPRCGIHPVRGAVQ